VDVPQPVKTVTAISFVAYATLVYQQADAFDLALPIKPALHAEPAYTGGTVLASGEGAYSPPYVPIVPRSRAVIQLDS
jgi:hypothetical protein